MQKIQLKNHRLRRNEKRLIQSLKSIWIYKFTISILQRFFSPLHTFITVGWKWLWKIKGIISVSTYKIFGRKIWYIDNFVINKKARWKWLWKKLILKSIEKSEQTQHDYVALISDNKRKASHKLYQKVWFSVISLWAFVFAYKKLKGKKK